MSWWGQTFLGIITHITHTSTHVKVFGQQYPPFEISVRGEEGCYTASHTMCYAVTVMLYICACFHIFTKGFHQLHPHFFPIQWEYRNLNTVEVIVFKRRSLIVILDPLISTTHDLFVPILSCILKCQTNPWLITRFRFQIKRLFSLTMKSVVIQSRTIFTSLFGAKSNPHI